MLFANKTFAFNKLSLWKEKQEQEYEQLKIYSNEIWHCALDASSQNYAYTKTCVQATPGWDEILLGATLTLPSGENKNLDIYTNKNFSFISSAEVSILLKITYARKE